MKKMLLFASAILIVGMVQAQKLEIKLHYEDRPNVSTWWKANKQVHFSLDDKKKHQYDKSSRVCLKVRWDSITGNRQNVWFTDLKIDSLANPVMDKMRAEFGDKIWLSFWCNTGKGDTLLVQPLLLTRGHKGKWGANSRTPICSEKWVFVKFNLAELDYSKWGEGPALPDLKSDAIRCFEVGLLNAATAPKGFIEARFDDVMISNYEPFAKGAKEK